MRSDRSNFAWREFLRVAEQLYNDRNTNLVDEALYRTIAGRAYYAAFHMLRENVGEQSFETSHEAVVQKCLASSNEVIRRLGSRLLSMKKIRVQADYRDRTFTLSDAQDCLSKANKIKEDLSSLS